MRTILAQKIKDEELFLWTPQLPGDPCKRTLLVTGEINDEFDESTWKDLSLAYRYAQLAADFDRFVTGQLIPVGMAPYDKGDDAFMARVDPSDYGVWTIRSIAPSPAIRVFGGFAEKDVFVALHSRLRAGLKGRGSVEWAGARENAIARWDNLFPGMKPLLGEKVDDFISEETIAV